MRQQHCMPFRIIRGPAGNYQVRMYRSRAARDKAARKFAALDGDSVLTELWSAEHSQDAINRGWACDGRVEPPEGSEPRG